MVSVIKNCQWRNIKDITNGSKLPKAKTIKILEFLADYDFLDLDSKHQKVKVTPSLAKFLKENSRMR